MYRIASRYNTNGDKFDIWPAVLNSSFNEFDNRIEPTTFINENDIYKWLDSKRRSLENTKQTKNQEICNGDPNRIYSVYMCNHTDTTHTNGDDGLYDTFLYNLRLKKTSESIIIYQTEKGIKRNSSFNKIHAKIDFNNNGIDMLYSSDPCIVGGELYEGVYPLAPINEKTDTVFQEYQGYVTKVREADVTKSNSPIDMVMVDSSYGERWLSKFLKKLKYVELYLDFFAKGGDIFVKLPKDPASQQMISYIYDLMEKCRQNTSEDDLFQESVRNMISDPALFQGSVFQIRCDKTLITWNKNYSYILSKYKLIPSKIFADIIMNFNMMNFYRQYRDSSNLQTIIGNLETIYGVNSTRMIQSRKFSNVPKTPAKFKMISRSFG